VKKRDREIGRLRQEAEVLRLWLRDVSRPKKARIKEIEAEIERLLREKG
jgi:hypothetical protein